MPKLSPKVKDALVVSSDPNTSVALTESQLKIIVKPSVEDVRSLIDRAITEDDWIDIIRVFREQALNGDRKSAEFLAKYRFGLPPQMVQHSGKVGHGVTIVEVVRTEEEFIEGEAKDA